MLHSGIDLHKRTIAIATVTPDGQAVQDRQLPATRAAVRADFRALPGPHRAVVESTSNWYWLRDLLVSDRVELRLGHSKYVRGSATRRRGPTPWMRHARAAARERPDSRLAQLRTTMLAEQHALLGARAKRPGAAHLWGRSADREPAMVSGRHRGETTTRHGRAPPRALAR